MLVGAAAVEAAGRAVIVKGVGAAGVEARLEEGGRRSDTRLATVGVLARALAVGILLFGT